MRAGETELQMCVRHVAEQENRVARQDVLVERLRESGSLLLDDALRLLAEMHNLLKTMHEHVARLDPRWANPDEQKQDASSSRLAGASRLNRHARLPE
jgi:hypothetical protein